MDQDEIKVKSLKKALDVLNCFLVKPTWGVTEISDRLGLYKSNDDTEGNGLSGEG